MKEIILSKVRIILVVAFTLLSFSLMSSPAPVSADAKGAACSGIKAALGDDADCSSDGASAEAENKINNAIATAVNILSLAVAIISVIMIIIAGIKYVTSGGDSNSVSSARNTIIYAIVGLIIVSLAQAIVKLVINRVVTQEDSFSGSGGSGSTAPSVR